MKKGEKIVEIWSQHPEVVGDAIEKILEHKIKRREGE